MSAAPRYSTTRASRTIPTSCRPFRATSRSRCSARARIPSPNNGRPPWGRATRRRSSSFNTLTGGPQLFLASADRCRRQEGELLHAQGEPLLSRRIRRISITSPMPRDFARAAPTIRCRRRPAARISRTSASLPAPATFSSDTVDSFEFGAKNNFDNRVKLASSIYYIRWNNIQQTVVPPDLPDFVHRQSWTGRGQGRRHPGRRRVHRRLLGRTGRRLHRRDATPRIRA